MRGLPRCMRSMPARFLWGTSAVTKIVPLLTLLVPALVCSLVASPALAQRDRVFVASYGSDSNPCTFGSPCKTFQNAINVVAQGGEVTAIDSAGFGTFTISHAVTITSPNGVEAGVAAPSSGGAAITINAESTDVISLNGLTLDGDNVTNTTGIVFNTGGSLNVVNCVIRNFTNYGPFFDPVASSQLFVSNSLLTNNGNVGIYMYGISSGAVTGVLDHVALVGNTGSGLYVQAGFSQPINVTVADSVSANNGNGIVAYSESSAVNMMIRSTTITNNTSEGIAAYGANATIWITRSTATANGAGWYTTSGGVITTYGDNNIIGNGDNNGSPSTPITYQ
jgi:hypothetical protein